MKHLILFASLLALGACSSVKTPSNSRHISSVSKDLTGTYLGVADYGRGHPGPNRPAVRMYFHPTGKPGTFDVLLLEYVDLIKMAPSYVASNKLPFIARRTGFLKNINSKIFAYEATATSTEGSFALYPLVVEGDQIVVKRDAKPRLLILDPTATDANPLAGATLSSVGENDPKEIFFPKKDDGKKAGIQYETAKLAYKVAKLESTWRKEFLNGPYLSQYYHKKDVVLKLRDGGSAEFLINPDYASMDEEKREKMFTNEKSAFIKGNFRVTEPRDGMFLFHSVDADEKSKKIVEGKIGLFIDIFDATKSLNQDVVELAVIDSENPEDFLMYYEHPDNGEGTDPVSPE